MSEEIRTTYKKLTGKDTTRIIKDSDEEMVTIVFEKQYVEWLENRLVALNVFLLDKGFENL